MHYLRRLKFSEYYEMLEGNNRMSGKKYSLAGIYGTPRDRAINNSLDWLHSRDPGLLISCSLNR